MVDCASSLTFAEMIEPETGEIHYRLQNADFCRVRQCPVCMWRRALKWSARFIKAIPRIEVAHPTKRWIFVTLTVRNVPVDELKETIRWMKSSFRKMQKYKGWPAKGMIRGLEVTKGSDGLAHPHFHCLMLVNSRYFKSAEYWPQATWQANWKKALRVDYDPIVDVRAVKPQKPDRRMGQIDIARYDLAAAAVETMKYAVKPEDLADDDNWLFALTDQLHGVRSIEIFGDLKPFFSDDEPEEAEELLHLDDEARDEEELQLLRFTWRRVEQRYGRSK